MFVQRVVVSDSRRESWTVLGGDGVPVEPVERYRAYLSDVERSPNTVKAYAHDLKDWFVFLGGRTLDWREVRLEQVGAPQDEDLPAGLEPLQTPRLGHPRQLFCYRSAHLLILPQAATNFNYIREPRATENSLARRCSRALLPEV